ncbi:MAG TPA: NADH-quinone oxidoreductase subunit I, partial [Oleiagrimonas sp.]|nr:NADH-quinone oxidoreductase subunit I [Oleiagrimonas sp.]HET8554147.1 NADH-quinone oxidoreductase subunit I [Rhodanobacteraceae bacterium]
MSKITHYFKSLLLIEMLKGLGVTIVYMFKPKYTMRFPM